MNQAALLTLITSWLVPAVALACPVCFDATDANRGAYLGTTIFMSLLPLGVIGSIVVFLYVRAKRAQVHTNRPSRLRSVNSSNDIHFGVRSHTGKPMDSKG